MMMPVTMTMPTTIVLLDRVHQTVMVIAAVLAARHTRDSCTSRPRRISQSARVLVSPAGDSVPSRLPISAARPNTRTRSPPHRRACLFGFDGRCDDSEHGEIHRRPRICGRLVTPRNQNESSAHATMAVCTSRSLGSIG
jgi:hypothetical protein